MTRIRNLPFPLLTLSLLMFTAGRTHAAASVGEPPPPSASVIIDGEMFDLSRYIKQSEDSKYYFLDGTVETGNSSIHVTGLYNTDPFITFGATTTNFGPGPISYTFIFGTPIVPGLYNQATSTGGLTFTNGASGTSFVNNGGSNPLSYISGFGSVGMAMTNLGVDIGVGGVVAGPGAPFTVTVGTNYGPAVSTFAPTFYNNLEAIVSYTQTDIGSVASWSGAVTLNAVVPEPTSVVMLGIGLLLASGTRVLRRRIN